VHKVLRYRDPLLAHPWRRSPRSRFDDEAEQYMAALLEPGSLRVE
jgi:hypothetical protein